MSPTATAAYSNWRNLAVGVLMTLTVMPLSVASAQSTIDARVLNHLPLGATVSNSPMIFAPGSLYENWILKGTEEFNGGAGLDVGRILTRMLIDDVTPNSAGNVSKLRFTVVNRNDVSVKVRALVRFWEDADNAPGTFIKGFNINTHDYAPGIHEVTVDLNQSFPVTTSRIWCGWAYDDLDTDTGLSTGATAPQLNNFGQAYAFAPTLGSSQDRAVRTNLNRSFFGVDAPAHAILGPGTNPEFSFALELGTDASTPSTKSTWGRVKQLYR